MAERLTLNLSSGGDVVIKLRPDLAPGHVERIAGLAREGVYDGVVLHRGSPGFMAQGGGAPAFPTAGPNSPANLMSAAPARWPAPVIRTAPTASSSSVSTTPVS